MCFLPSFFSHEIAYNLAINSTGGMIIAWKRSFHLVASWSTRHTLSVQLKHTGTNEIFTVSNAYGPTDDALKEGFIQELSCPKQLLVDTRGILQSSPLVGG